MNKSDAMLNGLDRLGLVSNESWAPTLEPGWFDVVEAALAEGGFYIAPIGRAADHPTARSTDPRTSQGNITYTMRANSQRHRLLKAYEAVNPHGIDGIGQGLSDEEAMEAAEGVRHDSEYATRCSELRNAGWIIDTGADRKGATGTPRIVCRITDAGRVELRRLG